MLTTVVLDDLEKVAASNKGITIEEYLNDMKKRNEMLAYLEKQEDEAIKQYFENLYGKYVVIHLNGLNDNFIVFHFNKKIETNKRMQKFENVISLSKRNDYITNIQIEKSHEINLLWLGCREFNHRNCFMTINEYITFIDEETYNKIYNKATSVYNEFFDILSQN